MIHWLIWAIFQILAIISSPEWKFIGLVLFWTGTPLILIALWRSARATSCEAAVMQQVVLGLMGILAATIATTLFFYSPPGGRALSVGIGVIFFFIGLFVALFKSNESRER